ncbi:MULTISPECIES: hypothetical protein [Streptomycetaceae]|uniref:hypothetical protein n=1 Tax=Streptomycetaceae TaxID=2062 RepID=UPI00093DA8DE|nr:hypothetical protein [Streptomyces sp. CB02056]
MTTTRGPDGRIWHTWSYHLVDGRELLTLSTSEGLRVFEPLVPPKPSELAGLQMIIDSGPSLAWIHAARVAREIAASVADTTCLERFGRVVLGAGRSKRWAEAVSTALLGDWVAPLHDGTGLGMAAVDRLREETRVIHRQLVPLWERRTYGNRRVALLESPVYEGATLRDLLAGTAADDPVLDQVPGDRRLAAVLVLLSPGERAVVLALGRPGVATWAEAAALTGSTRPDKDGEAVRRKVRRAVRELRRRDGQRTDGPRLWTPARGGDAR